MVVIQANVRGTDKYRRTISALAYIHTWWRGAAAVSRHRQVLHAVVVIQAGVRDFIVGTRYRRDISAGTHIQTWWWGVAAVTRYCQKLGGVAVIQTNARGVIVADKYRRAISALTYIQTWWRGAATERTSTRNFMQWYQ